MTLFTIILEHLYYLSSENNPRSLIKGDQLDIVRARETDLYKKAPSWFYQQYYAMLEVKMQTCLYTTKTSSYLIQAQSLWEIIVKD